MFFASDAQTYSSHFGRSKITLSWWVPKVKTFPSGAQKYSFPVGCPARQLVVRVLPNLTLLLGAQKYMIPEQNPNQSVEWLNRGYYNARCATSYMRDVSVWISCLWGRLLGFLQRSVDHSFTNTTRRRGLGIRPLEPDAGLAPACLC